LTLAAGEVANTFGLWSRVEDNNGVHFSEIFTGHLTWDRHISAIVLEDASIKDKIYYLELAYGDARTMITRMRLIAGNTKVGATNRATVRAAHIPSGEYLYYRMMCETANATLEIHLRTHCHEPD